MVKRKLEEGESQDIFYGHGDKWFRGKVISEGDSSTTFLAMLKKPNSRFSEASFPLQMAVKSSKDSNSITQEKTRFLVLAGCPFIVQCFAEEETTGDNDTTIHNLLFEFASDGNLADLLERSGQEGLPESDVRRYTRCILQGLSHIHKNGYVLNGLKADKILMFPDGSGTDGMYVAKIGDLGSAEEVGDVNKCKDGDGTSKTLTSEPTDRIPGTASDIWDLGCLVLEMLLGKCRSDGNPGLKIEDLACKIRDLEKKSEFAKNFLKCCLVKQDEQTLTAEMLLKHPFFNEEVLVPKPYDVIMEESKSLPSLDTKTLAEVSKSEKVANLLDLNLPYVEVDDPGAERPSEAYRGT